jgi:hypothetical protein
MGLLDDAIREHLELKRKHGADPEDVERQEKEALSPGGPRAEFAQPETDAVVAQQPEIAESEPEDALPEGEPDVPEEPTQGHPAAAPGYDEDPWLDDEVPAEEALERRDPPPTGEEDVLEETPDFLQETPEHDRLWFEQKPPRDFDWDK